MVMKSLPVDDMNCVVFAIRGSQTFMDWAVNLKSEPVAPVDFLVGYKLDILGSLLIIRRMIPATCVTQAFYQSHERWSNLWQLGFVPCSKRTPLDARSLFS